MGAQSESEVDSASDGNGPPSDGNDNIRYRIVKLKAKDKYGVVVKVNGNDLEVAFYKGGSHKSFTSPFDCFGFETDFVDTLFHSKLYTIEGIDDIHKLEPDQQRKLGMLWIFSYQESCV